MLKTIWEDVDKQEIAKSVVLLDLFTKPIVGIGMTMRGLMI